MPAKPSLEKLSWQWAETTDPANISQEHVRTAYRLNLPVCKLAACKRQCKGNPYCLNCIGEKVWFGKIDDSSWHDIQDPSEERRQPGMFVGLKNLGATCYVNTFLQLWFMNSTIRKGVLEWRETDRVKDEKDWEPDSVCSHLQVIFGLLELSNRRFIDPSNFIKHLGLDAGLQQDAQEFSNLFLSVLEQNLQQGTSLNGHKTETSNVIKEQFCGSYAYVTTCNKCSKSSECPSQFYELDLNIQGHRTLSGSLKGFLEVEKLEGNNQYMCQFCNAKQDATRAIRLKNLPPVLNLQLLRFVFDLKTGSKKKLNSCIQFPDVLDMREYLPEDQSAVYDLSAVLIHRGVSAYSGHYVAHIKSKDHQAWYKFNDEEVEKIKGRNLQLGSEDDVEGKKEKVARTPKGHHSSKNAYMLVYKRRKHVPKNTGSTSSDCVQENNIAQNDRQEDSAVSSDTKPSTIQSSSEQSVAVYSTYNEIVKKSESAPLQNCVQQCPEASPKPDNISDTAVPEATSELQDDQVDSTVLDVRAKDLLPNYVLDYIERDREKFEHWVLEMNNMREDNIAKGQEKQETVRGIYQDLSYTKEDGDRYEWIAMSWMSKWLTDPSTAPAIDMSKLLCPHGRACPEQCLKMKCVALRGSQQLFSIYGGQLRLQGDKSLCDTCVRNKCLLIRTKRQIAEDDKFITAAMKMNFAMEKCFLVGKGSFRSWRRLAVEVLEGHEGGSKVDSSSSGSDVNANGDSDLVQGVVEESKPGESVTEVYDDKTVCDGDLSENSPIKSVTEDRGCDSENSGSAGDMERKETIASGSSSPSKPSQASNASSEAESLPDKKAKDDEETLQFNEDLLCDLHGGLDPDSSYRKIVPESVWVRLKKYFPGCAEFEATSPPCEKCTATLEAENESRHMNKQQAAVQKACLVDLFHDRKRPAVVLPNVGIYAVSTEFLESWRRFVRDPLKCEPVTHVVNGILLCEHQGYLYPPLEPGTLKSDAHVTYVTTEEWQRIWGFFETDYEIAIICLDDNDKEIITIPKVCDDCLEKRLIQEKGQLFDYEKGVIYVRKLLKLDNKPTEVTDNQDSKQDDCESFSTLMGRKRSSSGCGEGSSEPADKYTKSNDGNRNVRKSQRHRRVKGEKEVNISSKCTLKELKLEIMKFFHVAPFDQNLYIDGRLLEDNSESLAKLRVASGSVVELVADEPTDDSIFLEETSKESRVPESGFKGTNLLSA